MIFRGKSRAFGSTPLIVRLLLLSSVSVYIFENAVILPSPSYFNITNLQRDLTLPTQAKTWRLNSYHNYTTLLSFCQKVALLALMNMSLTCRSPQRVPSTGGAWKLTHA